MRSSRLVAESLRDVPDPLVTVLPPTRPASVQQMQRIRDAAAAPAQATGVPPTFLHPHQVPTWRLVMAALTGWRGAILADPVGSGKTWVAMAVATSLRQRITMIGPAALGEQWRRVADRTGVLGSYHSLERLSRGALPPPAALVVVDEAHRLRHLETRRVRTLAPWLTGRTALFLTATPLVNRRRDLLNLLALLVPDDALALDGIPSLAGLAVCRRPPTALRRLVIRTTMVHARPRRERRHLSVGPVERARGQRIAATVDKLQLSDEPGLQSLLRMVLLDAGGSSDAAWHAALRRYRDLLLQSRDAGGASRAALHRCLGDALDQLVFWPLLGDVDRSRPLPLDDIELVRAALDIPGHDDGWLRALEQLLRDGRPSVCFCRHRATAARLRRHLGAGTAWITGDGAGIGSHRVPRDALLAAFGPSRADWSHPIAPPTVLVATEVLAEGLDLQGASRVVHVDLPWHHTRLEQRTGRVWRLGQLAEVVEIVHRRPAPAIEHRLGLSRRVRRKRSMATAWLDALTTAPNVSTPIEPGVWVAVLAAPRSRPARVVLGLEAGARSGCCSVGDDGLVWPWTSEALPVDSPRVAIPTGEDRTAAIGLVMRAVRRVHGQPSGRPAGCQALIARLLALARPVARRRDRVALGRLDGWLSVAALPGAHGLELVLRRLATVEDAILLSAAPPAVAGRPVPTLRWALVLLYRRVPSTLP